MADALAILWMDAADPPRSVLHDVCPGIAAATADRIVPLHPIGRQIPIPDRIVRSSRGKTQPLLGVGKTFQRAAVGGDILNGADQTNGRQTLEDCDSMRCHMAFDAVIDAYRAKLDVERPRARRIESSGYACFGILPVRRMQACKKGRFVAHR